MAVDQNHLKSQLANQQQRPVAVGIKSLMGSEAVKKRFEEVLKHKAPQFMASIINLVNTSPELQEADGMSVIQSAMVAAALDLPVDKNLGYMWIIGRRDKNRGNAVFASPQLGYKGFIQLALRTAQYREINVIDVYEGELVSWNRLTEKIELDYDAKTSDKVTGYAAHFELLNGFKKTVYWTREQVVKHKTQFSKTAMVWNSDFDAMARKTVLKSMLSRWGILSIEMQRAIIEDEREEVGESGIESEMGEIFDITATVKTDDDNVLDGFEQTGN